ncbi:MAG: tetratricopeptide repeat protein [Armatimonadota bacterium]
MARRWAQILLLLGQRPVACGAVLATALLSEGLGAAAVRAAIALVAPPLAAGQWHGPEDADYVRAELEHLAAPNFNTKLALAYAAARHDPGFAARVAAEARDTEPDNWRADVCLGYTAEKSARHAQAIDHYAAAAQKGCRDCFEAWARTANEAGQHQTALNVIDQAPALSPALELERARAIRALRSPREALNAYASLDPEATGERNRVLAEMAECQLSLGLYRDAVRTARIPAQAGERLALRVTAMAHFGAQQWADAAHALVTYLSAAPEDGEAWQRLAWSHLMLGQLEAAVEAGSTALRLAPRNADAVSATVQALVRLARYREALELCNIHGHASVPYAYRARALLESGELTEAARTMEDWIAQEPHDAGAWLAMGYLAERLGRFEDARGHYAQALRVAPANQEARNRYNTLSDAIVEGAVTAQGERLALQTTEHGPQGTSAGPQ